MVENFIKKYINIYLFQGISVILGFVSLFIVLPFLSSNKDLYGIYSICTSLTIYFSYADLGFGSVGQKFAVESYVRNDRIEEMRIIGFTTWIFITFMSVISVFILLLSINPSLVLKGITPDYADTAQLLLIILALSSPTIALNRALSIIYSIRLEDYKFQRIQIICNIVKILSVFFFFGQGRYLLVPYYLFINIVSFIGAIYALIYIHTAYNYDLIQFIKCIKPDKVVFNKLKGMASAGFVSMVCWIIYYELDQIIIGSMFGVEAVATYAVAFSVLTYFRTYFGVIFSPLTARFNYYVGAGDMIGFSSHVRRVCAFFVPFVVIPICVVVLFASPFVISWVGCEYTDSIIHVKLLSLCNILAFISYPVNTYIIALKKNKELIRISIINAVIFWAGIALLHNEIGVLSFPIMKLLAFVISAMYNIYLVVTIQKLSLQNFIIEIFRYNIIPLIIVLMLSLTLLHAFNWEISKSIYNLLITLSTMGGIVIIGIGITFIINPLHKSKLIEIKNSYAK